MHKDLSGKFCLRFRGQKVISQRNRVVGIQKFINITIEDGSSCDLLDSEYAIQVKNDYPFLNKK